jgi:hypothetical protein
MPGGRRLLILLVVAPLTFLAGRTSAAAQTTPSPARYCAQAATIPVDKDSLVKVAVTVGDVAPTDVKITFAEGIDVKQAFAVPGWTAKQLDSSSVVFSGGQAAPNECLEFPIMVHPTSSGTFAARAFQTTPSGETVERPENGEILLNRDGSSVVVNYGAPPNPVYEQVIYVTSDGSSFLQSPLAAVLAAVVVVGIAALIIRRWTPKQKPSRD